MISPKQVEDRDPKDEPSNARETVDVGLDLLDRQLLDKAGKPVGKIDDLELVSEGGETPVLTGILVGPAALAPRVGRVGRRVARLRLRLRDQDEPARIDFGRVEKIGPDVHLAVGRDELDRTSSEPWAREILGKLLGGGR